MVLVCLVLLGVYLCFTVMCVCLCPPHVRPLTTDTLYYPLKEVVLPKQPGSRKLFWRRKTTSKKLSPIYLPSQWRIFLVNDTSLIKPRFERKLYPSRRVVSECPSLSIDHASALNLCNILLLEQTTSLFSDRG